MGVHDSTRGGLAPHAWVQQELLGASHLLPCVHAGKLALLARTASWASADEEDGDSENVGYAVPALLLQNIICEYEAAAASGPHGHTAEGSRSPSSSSLAGQHAGHDHGQEGQGGGPGSQPGRSSPPGIVRGQGQPGGTENGHDLVPEEGCNRSSAAGEAVGWKGEVAVAGPPYLGVRWRHLESLVLRRSLGLRKGNTGALTWPECRAGRAAGRADLCVCVCACVQVCMCVRCALLCMAHLKITQENGHACTRKRVCCLCAPLKRSTRA